MNYKNIVVFTVGLVELIALIILIIIRQHKQKYSKMDRFPDRLFNVCLYLMIFIFAGCCIDAVYNLTIQTNEFISLYGTTLNLLFFSCYLFFYDNSEAFNKDYLQIGLNNYNMKNLKVLKLKKRPFNRVIVTFIYNDEINKEKKVLARMSENTYKNLELVLR